MRDQWGKSTARILCQPEQHPVHNTRVKSVCFSPDGTNVVSGGDDCSVQLCDGITGCGDDSNTAVTWQQCNSNTTATTNTPSGGYDLFCSAAQQEQVLRCVRNAEYLSLAVLVSAFPRLNSCTTVTVPDSPTKAMFWTA